MENDQVFSIRNFSIIAHIDHGKSTLADKIIRLTTNDSGKKLIPNALDNLEVEKQKGITIKLNPIRLEYQLKKENSYSKKYLFNLIDTPGHADFGYEVSRSLASCEGVILLVDSTKGVQAQTIAYLKIANDLNLKIIPVINKIDLPSSRIEETKKQIKKIVDFRDNEITLISAKTGLNIDILLKKIVDFIPSPKIDKVILECEKNLKALIFDLLYDRYNGVIVYIRIFDGLIKNKQKIKFFYGNKIFQVDKIGVKVPESIVKNELRRGEIGWFTANIKDMNDIQVGDTVFDSNEKIDPLPGYKKIKPNLYSNFYPEEISKYKETKKAINELKLQDSSFHVKNIESNLLGSGFRCGFLGLLHKEVIQERLRQEYKLEIIATPPTLSYQILTIEGETIEISNPQKLLDKSKIKSISELFIIITMTVLENHIGQVSKLCQEKRGVYRKSEFYDDKLWVIEYEMPFAEFVFDFNDRIKSITQGYASFEYDFIGFIESKIVKVDILLNGEKIEDLSFFVHQSLAYEKSKKICDNLKFTLNPQNFEILIQACIGNKIIARETIKQFRKDVIGKCSGGDYSRKRKLLEKQKKGKKKMKEMGKITFSKNSLRNILKKRESN